jgi:hypothetical protein
LLDKYHVKCDYDNIFGVKGTRWLRSLKLSDNDQILLHEYIMQIEFLNTEIKNVESKIIWEASRKESVKILMCMTGIDYFSAMMIVMPRAGEVLVICVAKRKPLRFRKMFISKETHNGLLVCL